MFATLSFEPSYSPSRCVIRSGAARPPSAVGPQGSAVVGDGGVHEVHVLHRLHRLALECSPGSRGGAGQVKRGRGIVLYYNKSPYHHSLDTIRQCVCLAQSHIHTHHSRRSLLYRPFSPAFQVPKTPPEAVYATATADEATWRSAPLTSHHSTLPLTKLAPARQT
jgi:hypothetical protein